MSETGEAPKNPEQTKTPQELNQEFKAILALFPPPGLPVFKLIPDPEDEGYEFLVPDDEGVERARNRQNGELKASLFDKIRELTPNMHLTPSGRLDLLKLLEIDFRLGIPNPDLSIEERLLKAPGRALVDYIDAKNLQSPGVFDKETGGRIEEERFKRFSHSVDRKKKNGELKPEDLSRKQRWERDLYPGRLARAVHSFKPR